jgi:hypothetical protein
MLDYFAITFAPSPGILPKKLKLPVWDLLVLLMISSHSCLLPEGRHVTLTIFGGKT